MKYLGICAISSILCIINLLVSSIVMADGLSVYANGFSFPHAKSEKCAEDWMVMEGILTNAMLRCREVIPIEGFPYLRGNRQLLELASTLHGKYSEHKWLELLRRADLQARYKELILLPHDKLAELCSSVKIDCLIGRIRAWVAKCSATIMGDEKRAHDFMVVLKRKAMEALTASGSVTATGVKCFDDPGTLDGIVPAIPVESMSDTDKHGAKSHLDQRVRGMKNNNMPYSYK